MLEAHQSSWTRLSCHSPCWQCCRKCQRRPIASTWRKRLRKACFPLERSRRRVAEWEQMLESSHSTRQKRQVQEERFSFLRSSLRTEDWFFVRFVRTSRIWSKQLYRSRAYVHWPRRNSRHAESDIWLALYIPSRKQWRHHAMTFRKYDVMV